MTFPMGERRKDQVENRMSSVEKSRKREPVEQGAADVDDEEGAWVDRVHSMDVSEGIEAHDISRRRIFIDRWVRNCDRLQAMGPLEGAENDFHPKNHPTMADDASAEQNDGENSESEIRA
jgi:hypothetical protein